MNKTSSNNDSLMVHGVSGNLVNNAARFCHNSIQGHFHSVFGVIYHADKASLRWSMGVGCLMDPNSPAARYGAKAILKRPILGCGLIISSTKRILVISDLHIPYHHQDAFKFLKAVYDKWECNTVICVGDIWDHHTSSYHETEHDAYSPEEEFALTKKYAQELQELFPKMVITPGNHCALPKRKAKTAGLALNMIKDFNAMYDLKKSWKFVDEYWFDSKGGTPMVVPMTLKENGRWDKKVHV